MLYELAYTLIGLVGLAYVLDYALGLRYDAREPPRLPSRIPLIGHLLGIVYYGTVYYNQTRYVNAVEVGPPVADSSLMTAT